ncbi:MAG: L-lactate dehydrogenase, partial [Erysipelotrichaceae bacterium]
NELHDIYTQVQQAGYEIVKRKKSTYYGIGLSLNHLIHAILDDENVILTISAYQNGEYGQEGLYIGVPAVINRGGIREIVKIDLNEIDQAKFNKSCETIKEVNKLTLEAIK